MPRHSEKCKPKTQHGRNHDEPANETTESEERRSFLGEQFDRTLDDSFNLQDEITGRVLSAINVRLVLGEQAKVWHKTLKDLRALEAFYKGVHAFYQMDRESMQRARQYLRGWPKFARKWRSVQPGWR
jgi:hypothetical protein